ncbi:hypothetical protein SZ25_00119 [Candidatus Arcanobacter lacustris]|uniref:Uncharacterized protein n=1 Tax=Candidatus Arcanibacter lacustris TaxID=1607817 RepID=A0A0F5MQF2_9RICK|nr:hypothetical protein SZ25_00119 [Candidatus Arcanobacter lacustris]
MAVNDPNDFTLKQIISNLRKKQPLQAINKLDKELLRKREVLLKNTKEDSKNERIHNTLAIQHKNRITQENSR